MDIGTGDLFAAWAGRAEGRGFSTLASIGRLAYESYDELIAFAQAAGVKDHIRLMPNLLLAPPILTSSLRAAPRVRRWAPYARRAHARFCSDG